MTKVSVVIPCHNVEKYVATCLNSVLKQTMEDIEVIAIDDHSTDQTLKILKYFQKQYPLKLRVYRLQEKNGVSAARNLGLDLAQGEYIGFVDADDLVSLNMYQDFYNVAIKEQVPIVVGGFKRIECDEYINHETFKTSVIIRQGILNYVSHGIFFFGEAPSCWDKLFKHDFVADTRFLEGKVFEDIGFTFPLLLKAKKAYEFLREDYYYRKTPGSIMRNVHKPTCKIFDLIDVCLYMEKFADEHHFDQTQRILLEDCIKERLLYSLELVDNWKVSEDKRDLLLKKMVSVYEYFFPNFQSFSTKYARFLFSELSLEFSKYIPLQISDEEDLEKQKGEILKLVKCFTKK